LIQVSGREPATAHFSREQPSVLINHHVWTSLHQDPSTTYLIQYRNGAIVREGTGLSFFYYGPTTSLIAIPVGSGDEPFIFEETTADHQTITLQGQVTYRVADPKKLAGLMNFTLAPNGHSYLSDDPGKAGATRGQSGPCAGAS
jgi:hypothetical protein